MRSKRYSEPHAEDEAARLLDKVSSGAAPDFEAAEAQIEAEHAARLHELEFIVSTRLERVLCEQFRKINEGNAGVILKLSFDEVPPDVVAWLEEQGIELRDNQVAKILKLYSRGRAKEEFDMQKKAYDALRPYEDDPTVAKVARPHFWRELKLSEATQEVMHNAGVKVSDHVEVIMMDYVPGEDIAAKLMKELMVMGHYMIDASGEALTEEAQKASYLDLDRMGALSWVANYLGWKEYVPGPGERLTPEEIQARKEKVNDTNEGKLYRALRDRGFYLHPSVVMQIEKAMHILHQNGVVFRDGHHRNFMIDGEWSGHASKAPSVTIVDFGQAVPFEGDYASQEGELYQSADEGKGFTNDFAVARKLKPLTVPPEARERHTPAADFNARLETKRVQMMAAKPSRFLDDLKKIAVDTNVKPSPEQVYDRMPGTDDLKLENTMAAFMTLIEQGLMSEDAARSYLQTKKRELSKPLANKIGYFLESL